MPFANYFLRVQRMEYSSYPQHEPVRNPKPTDFFMFQVTAKLHCYSLSNWNHHIHPINMTTLFETYICTPCEHFFRDNECFKQKLTAPPYFTPENVNLITERIVLLVQQLFNFNPCLANDDPGLGLARSSDSKRLVFPLDLEILVDMLDEDEELGGLEESMQDVEMIPASSEAIESLKTYNLPKQCHICMEKFHDEGDGDHDEVKFTPMPCGHGFHHQCIVYWLQTSHMCPLCRYPMPTNNN